MILIRIILILFLFSSPLWAETYWVDDNGTKTTKTDCDGATPISGTDACTLAAANGFALAGDIVYLRAGTYTITGNGIAPTNSGSAGNVITFSGYESEVVTITGAVGATGKDSIGVNLNGKSYIKVTKINVANVYQGLFITNGGNYNEISYCTFAFRDAWAVDDNGVYTYDPAGISIGHGQSTSASTHNWIHHNVMHGCGGFNASDQGVLFAIGSTQGENNKENSNNTIEYNHLYHGGHHVFANNYGFYNVIRKNYMHNEGWFSDAAYDAVCSAGDNGVCGYRVVYSHGDTSHTGYALYEDNFIGYADQYGRQHVASGGPGGALNIANDHNIVRYNDLVGNVQYGYSGTTSLSSPTKDGENNRIYNNTFFQNGFNYITYGVTGNDNTAAEVGADIWRTHVLISDSDAGGNAIKNNLFHNAWSETNKLSESQYYPSITAGTANNIANNTISNNYVVDTTYTNSDSPFTDTDDPKFVSETLPANSAAIIAAWSSYAVTTPNLALQSTSTAINAGSYLTQANGAGTNSTALIVDDASYFQDGTWGSSLATLNADWIAIGTAGNVHQISSINYGTNTITLATPTTWADNASIWLYKKSDGTQVLYGSAPDMGAHEYQPVAGLTFGTGGSVGLGSGGSIGIN